jgi:hypothetical protein
MEKSISPATISRTKIAMLCPSSALNAFFSKRAAFIPRIDPTQGWLNAI